MRCVNINIEVSMPRIISSLPALLCRAPRRLLRVLGTGASGTAMLVAVWVCASPRPVEGPIAALLYGGGAGSNQNICCTQCNQIVYPSCGGNPCNGKTYKDYNDSSNCGSDQMSFSGSPCGTPMQCNANMTGHSEPDGGCPDDKMPAR